MGTDGKRLGQGGLIGGKAIGHRQEHLLGQDHTLGKPAGQQVGKSQQFDAPGREGRGHGDDPGPHLERSGGARAVFQDFGAELVSKDRVRRRIEAAAHAARRRGQGDHVFHVMQSMEIGAADPAGQGLDPHLSGLEDRVGQVVTDQLFVTTNDGAHGGLQSLSRCRVQTYPLTLPARSR